MATQTLSPVQFWYPSSLHIIYILCIYTVGFYFSPGINILAANLSRLTFLQLQIQWEEKLFFSKSLEKNYDVLISIGQNHLPCLFLSTIHRCQRDDILQLAKPETHTHHSGAQRWWQPHLRNSWTQNGREGGSPGKSDYCYNKKGLAAGLLNYK